jgi:hypothetical protein
MGMIGHYLQVSPEQVAAMSSGQLVVNHTSFHVGGSLTPVSSHGFPPLAGLVIIGIVVLIPELVRRRNSVRPRWRWAIGLALVGAVLAILGLGSQWRTPALAVSGSQVSAPLRIDKSWHGIHFLLTGRAQGGSPPLSNAVLGGTEIGQDLGYGPARYLSPHQVKEVARALEPITKETLRQGFNPKAMTDAAIYCWFEDEGDEGLEYFLHYYVEVRVYFQDAARRGNGMILSVM